MLGGEGGESERTLDVGAAGFDFVPINGEADELGEEETFFEPVFRRAHDIRGTINVEGRATCPKPEGLDEQAELTDMVAMHVTEPEGFGDVGLELFLQQEAGDGGAAIEQKCGFAGLNQDAGMLATGAGMTIGLWSTHIASMVQSGRLKPDIDFLVLDGIPRNTNQAKILNSTIDVRGVFHLECKDKAKVYDRLKRRALKENRLDDINEEVIERRLRVYEEETKPVLDFYGPKLTTYVNADQWPYQVLRDILNDIEHYRGTPED